MIQEMPEEFKKSVRGTEIMTEVINGSSFVRWEAKNIMTRSVCR